MKIKKKLKIHTRPVTQERKFGFVKIFFHVHISGGTQV